MSNIITARGLRRTYGQGHDAFEAVKGIDPGRRRGRSLCAPRHLEMWRRTCSNPTTADVVPKQVNLTDRARVRVGSLSGGEKRRSDQGHHLHLRSAAAPGRDPGLGQDHGLRLSGLEARAATLESVFLDIATDPADHSASTHDMIGAKSIGYCSTAGLGRDRTVSDRTHWRRRPRLRQGFLTWLVNPQDQKELAGRAGKPVLVGSGGRSLPTDVDRTR